MAILYSLPRYWTDRPVLGPMEAKNEDCRLETVLDAVRRRISEMGNVSFENESFQYLFWLDFEAYLEEVDSTQRDDNLARNLRRDNPVGFNMAACLVHQRHRTTSKQKIYRSRCCPRRRRPHVRSDRLITPDGQPRREYGSTFAYKRSRDYYWKINS